VSPGPSKNGRRSTGRQPGKGGNILTVLRLAEERGARVVALFDADVAPACAGIAADQWPRVLLPLIRYALDRPGSFAECADALMSMFEGRMAAYADELTGPASDVAQNFACYRHDRLQVLATCGASPVDNRGNIVHAAFSVCGRAGTGGGPAPISAQGSKNCSLRFIGRIRCNPHVLRRPPRAPGVATAAGSSTWKSCS
jgi:hypothetical protein